MKTLFKSIILTAIIFFAHHTTFAQDDAPKRYYIVDYMKVEPGNHAEYLELEKVWKKVHQANIDAGKYEHWTLENVEYPFGTQVEYNYLTRINLSGEKQLANYIENWEMPDLQSILTEEEMAMMKRTNEIRTFVKSEVWSRTDRVLAENMGEPKVHVFNYFDFPESGGPRAHNKVEQEIWKPVHEARIKDGQMKGWALLEMELPYGAAQPYHAATVDIYDNMEQYLSQESPMPYFEKIHAGKKFEDLWSQTRKAATLTRAEVRTKLDDVGK